MLKRMWQSLFGNYGMVLVLVALGALFSVLTIRQQFPAGANAGRQVARRILRRYSKPRVLVVVRPTTEDGEFAAAAYEELRRAGATVIGVVRGGPAEARQAIERGLAQYGTIDAIAANQVTARWTVYDRFPEVGAQKCVVPRPYRWPDFLKVSNLLGVANSTAIYAMIAIGMTMVIITGGIDLSVGSLVALASVCSALIVRRLGGSDAALAAVLVAWFGGVLVCSAAGLLNGLLVTVGRLPPFIVTLGMMMMASGLAFRLSEGRSIPELPASYGWIGREEVVGVPNPILLMAVLYAIGHVVMQHTVFGRYIYAIGGNRRAAELSGVPVRRVLLGVYTVGGSLAGLGGIALTSQLAAGDPKFGAMYELEVIAAVVVGGTSLMGGRGQVMGTLVGAFIIAVIKNGMNLTNVDPFNQKIALGAVLTAAVLLDTLKQRSLSD